MHFFKLIGIKAAFDSITGTDLRFCQLFLYIVLKKIIIIYVKKENPNNAIMLL